jgi:phosphohistidine phosphatase
MDVYLMQHGEAKPESEDPERPLTDAGRATVERVAGRAANAGVRIERCVHSGKRRAEQSAQLLANAVGVTAVDQRDGLAPNDAVGPVADWLNSSAAEAGSLALVGHLPFLDRLAAVLVAGDEAAQAVRFQMGGLVKLVPKQERPGFAVAWVLAPDLA